MKRTTVLSVILIICVAITAVYFFIQNNYQKQNNRIIRQGDSLQVPVDMVDENGGPPETSSESFP